MFTRCIFPQEVGGKYVILFLLFFRFSCMGLANNAQERLGLRFSGSISSSVPGFAARELQRVEKWNLEKEPQPLFSKKIALCHRIAPSDGP